MRQTITSIRITEGACSWGTDSDGMSDAEARERQAYYEESATVALAEAYPDAEIAHDVDPRSDTRLRVTGYTTPDADGDPSMDQGSADALDDDVRAILGRAWQDACEASL